MLLFSTILEINRTLTKDAFIQLVIEWNQCSSYEENIIKNIEWHGERNVHYGDENLWLDIQEYRNQNIIAIRYEKKKSDGIIWDSDYIMNFKTMKMAIRLDRSYMKEALTVGFRFSSPHFITLLMERGYLKNDKKLPVLQEPVFIDEENIELLTNVINGKVKHRLPVVYISKTFYNQDPIDVFRLARKLKGLAHVLVQKNRCTNMEIKNQCEGKNEYYGAIGIYYPNQAAGHRKYLHRSSQGMDKILSEKVMRSVIQYSNSQMIDMLYTWEGVNNALLRDRLKSQTSERAAVEEERREALYELLTLKNNLEQKQASMQQEALANAKAEADKILDGFEEDMKRLQDEVTRLSQLVEKLGYENQGLRTKLDENTNSPILFMGVEDDFYPGEIKDLLLSTLSDALVSIKTKTRRYDVISDIIQANDYQHSSEQRAAAAKNLLKNYSGMTPKVKKGLEDIGYEVNHAGDHYKAVYYGDGRYTVVHGATPSDNRSGKNNVTNTINKAF